MNGYVSTNSKYIKIVSNAEIIYGVNFRTLPTSDSGSKVIRMLNKGEEVLITDKVNDSWYKIVDANGTSGYVSTGSKYMVTDFSVVVPNMPVADEIEAVIAAGNVYLGTPYEFGSVRNDPTTLTAQISYKRCSGMRFVSRFRVIPRHKALSCDP